MTTYTIEVRAIAEQYDVLSRQVAREILQLPTLEKRREGIAIQTAILYHLTGDLSPSDVDYLTHHLLIDPVTQQASITTTSTPTNATPASNNDISGRNATFHIVDIFFHPGVTDTLAESILSGAALLGIHGLERAATGHRYMLDSRLSADEVRLITETLLYNPVIQDYSLYDPYRDDVSLADVSPADASPVDASPADVPGWDVDAMNRVPTSVVNLADMDDEMLLDASKRGLLALNLAEMRTIQRHFREQGRAPTDVELETLAQTWSEHCSHKTFKALIEYREVDSNGHVIARETIDGLLKQYIMRATQQVARPWVVSAFSDNAGIVRFTETQDIAFKVETHNHPSAIEPFGGANTGVGGVIRDVLGVSARPIACTDILCFGPPDTPASTLPPGVLAPHRIAGGVVNGVRDYGNKMGIPTVNGAIVYHPGYIYNPLVFCGCLGMLPHGSHPRTVQPGDAIVVLGGRTGRDGIHGATFSSGEMSSEISAQAGSAVQIGAPITEKKVADVIMQARDRQLYHAITDCGAGGFSSAIGEMAAETGAYVELEKASLKYQGLAPWEIWLSEAQERMVLAVPSQHLDELLALCAIEEVEACMLGSFTDTHRLVVTYAGQTVADLDMAFLHDGRPGRRLEAVWMEEAGRGGAGRPQGSPLHTLLALLGDPTIASKEDVVRRYDHEVQGATVLKPLVGRAGNGPGDAAVLQPILDEASSAGIVLSNGVNPLHGLIDPYWMAMNAVDEAFRNLTAVGGDVERAAILDNFCWGNPTDPVQLGMLVRAVKGCYDAAVGFGAPFISGKDSLNNEYRLGGERLPVIPTLLISAVGVIDDASQTVDMSLKAPGNLLYLVGITRDEMPGSAVPRVDPATARVIMRATGEAIRNGLVQSCHDLSEGGLAVAAAEMSLAGMLGLSIDLALVPAENLEPGEKKAALLFSESASRFLVEVAPGQQAAFEAHMRARGVHDLQDMACIGHVIGTGRFVVQEGRQVVIDLAVDDLQTAWKGERV